MAKKFGGFILDFFYANLRFPNAAIKPRTYWGHFWHNQKGEYQKLMFKILKAAGFRRTFLQLVFPGQTAGLVKKVKKEDVGKRQYHVRFYRDGIIECEEELPQFSLGHYAGYRDYNFDFLTEIIESSPLSDEHKVEILSLFDNKDFCKECIRRSY